MTKIYIFFALLLLHSNVYADQSDRFKAYKEDVVLDRETNLLWVNTEKKPITYDLKEAEEYCATLNLDGISGWSVPSYAQMLTLVDYSTSAPAIYSIFVKAKTSREKLGKYSYWTSDAFPDNKYVNDRNYGVNFLYGHVEETLNYHAVRCVKPAKGGAKPFARFTRDDKKRVVVDSVNNVMWLDDPGIYEHKYGGYTFDEAQQFCQNVATAGFDDWRLPSIEELITVLDVTREKSPYVAEAFEAVRESRYFSSTQVVDKQFENRYWFVTFDDGHIRFTDYNSFFYCVRDIKEDENETE